MEGPFLEPFLDGMAAIVFVGTSFAVTITDILMGAAFERGVPIHVIDPNGKTKDGVNLIAERSDVAMPEIARTVGAFDTVMTEPL